MPDGKLVRDRIPEIMRAAGKVPRVKALDDNAFDTALREKLLEEIGEFIESGQTVELADILEVVYALAERAGVTPTDLERLRVAKRSERGGFEERLFLEA